MKAYLVPYGFPRQQIVTNPGYATPVLPEWKSVNDGYVIYPEAISGNPLNATNVIRWILFYPGAIGGPQANEYSKDEIIACYSIGVCKEFNRSFHLNLLKLTDYGLSYVHEIPKVRRREGILIHHKKSHWNSSEHDFDLHQGKLLDNNVGKYERMKLFSSFKVFITTDIATFFSVEAAMAGCLSIIVPADGISRYEWIHTSYGKNDLKYGIAYGKKDIPHALNTMSYVVPNLIKENGKQKANLRKFFANLPPVYGC